MARTWKDLSYKWSRHLNRNALKWKCMLRREKKWARKATWRKYRVENDRYSYKILRTDFDRMIDIDPPIFKKTSGWNTW